MSKITKTLNRVLRGNADANIRFDDLCALLSHLGFTERIRGDHHIFTRDGFEACSLPIGSLAGSSRNHGQPRTNLTREQARRQWREKGMASEIKYEIILYWSKDDQAFIAEVPELAGCAADGATYQEALANVEVVIQQWIETAQELGRPIPTPRGRLLYA